MSDPKEEQQSPETVDTLDTTNQEADTSKEEKTDQPAADDKSTTPEDKKASKPAPAEDGEDKKAEKKATKKAEKPVEAKAEESETPDKKPEAVQEEPENKEEKAAKKEPVKAEKAEQDDETKAPAPEAKSADKEPQDDQQPADDTPSAEVQEQRTAHDDFDWDAASDNYDRYSEKERAEMENAYETTISTVNNHEIVKGTVMSITDSDIVLNIGFKSDGMVSTSEFRDMPDLKIGDEVDVYVENKEDAKGQLILSRKNAKLMKAWDEISGAYENDTVVTGKIVSKTKGGLIVNVFGLETFLPGSQIDVNPIIDYDAYVGKTMEFKVVKINEAIKNAVVSHKALIESELEEQREEIISKLEKGQVLEGVIKNITDFGAFIDLGGVDGLLYITDISWGRINHPSEVLELNQRLNVVVLEYDDQKKRISLGLKQLTPHPWEAMTEELQEGNTVKGKVVNIEDYGAFLEIQPGIEGLVHVSEVSWSNHPVNAKEYFELGKEYDAKIVGIDKEERKMSLSIKQLSEDPWEIVEEKYPVNSKHTGQVRNITPYGVFVELDEYVGGMVHVSDLSWIKRYNHPKEVVKPGEELEVVVMEIDKENRKLSLSHKHIEEDPWDTLETVFPIGSVHEGTITRKDDKGATVQLPYGMEGFAPARHLKKEDGTTAQLEETMDFKILEFDRNDKRIVVSHTRLVSDKVEEEKTEQKRTRSRQHKETKRVLSNLDRKMEKSTLGDLGALQDLKNQMDEGEEEEAKPKSKKGTKKKATPKKKASTRKKRSLEDDDDEE